MNKNLNRPISTMNVRIPINACKGYHMENSKTLEKARKIIPFGNLCNVDLDSLFEKQLQKLREINRCEEEELKAKAKINSTLFDRRIIEEKKNDDINKIKDFNKKILDKNYINNNINKTKKIIYPRPLSNYRKMRNNILPSAETLTPGNNNIFKNRIFSNRNPQERKIIFNKISPMARPITTNKSPLHKEFGKVPKYLKEMKIRAKLMKDIEKKKEEEKNYPKGTRLLSEEERSFTLQKLKERKNELDNMISKLPISLDSFGAKNRQNKLYKDLDEIEQAIATFSKNKVFVKIDS